MEKMLLLQELLLLLQELPLLLQELLLQGAMAAAAVLCFSSTVLL